MNILVITKTGETFFTIKEFLETKGHQVDYIGIDTQYTNKDIVSFIPKNFLELNSIQKIDLILIDFYLKKEEFNRPNKSDFPSIRIMSYLQKENPTLKIAFMTDFSKLGNCDFHKDCKNINPDWLLIHKPDINNFAFTNSEDQFINCPYVFDQQLNKCHVFADFIGCKKIDCFYNQILLAAQATT